MRFVALPPFAAVTLALGLSACASYPPMVSQASFVDKIDVELKQDVTSAHVAEAVRTHTRREASRYGRSGAPKHIRIAVTQLHYKNPALALLVGDSNNIRAHVAVFDGASGQSHGEFDANAIDTYAINGIAGAVIAAAQDRNEVDQRLAQGLASVVLEKVYGSEVAKVARQRPTVDYPEAVPAAAPAPAVPETPKTAPKKAKEPKTAMAGEAPMPIAR